MDKAIVWLMAGFLLIGALDRIFGNRLGLGKQFEEGILAIGTLSLSMLGIMSLAPVLARLLRPVLAPVYGFLGADPAMFAGSILACDMGGAPLAAELAQSPEAAKLGGLIVDVLSDGVDGGGRVGGHECGDLRGDLVVGAVGGGDQDLGIEASWQIRFEHGVVDEP